MMRAVFFVGHRSPLEESPVLKKVRALRTATATATDDDDDDDDDDNDNDDGVHDSSHQTKWCISYSRCSSDEAHLISGLRE